MAPPAHSALFGSVAIFLTLTVGLAALPPLLPLTGETDVVIDGLGRAVWDAGQEPLAAGTTGSITLRNGVLRGAILLSPTPQAPVALATSGPEAGARWLLENMLLFASSCADLDAFHNLACNLQPAPWVQTDGWSVVIQSFTPSPPLSRTFTLSNVSITCEPVAEGAAGRSAANLSTLAVLSSSLLSTYVPACAVARVSSQASLIGLLSGNATLYGGGLPAMTLRLHVTVTANMSMDAAAWAAAGIVLQRPNVTISGDCVRVTALDLKGAVALFEMGSGVRLRLKCLELSNLASNAANVMPRGLLSPPVWAVKRESLSAPQFSLENCTLVLTKDEFVWQSFYLAQFLASATGSSVSSNIAVFLPTFQVSMTSSLLRWLYVWSSYTLWINCILTTSPSVFETTIPNSPILEYLGLTTFLTDLLIVSNCNQLLAAVVNASAIMPSDPTRPPRSVVLNNNISIGDCWPAAGQGGVAVGAASLTIMGLPDRSIALDLAGRADAFLLSPANALTIRFLTLFNLSIRTQADAKGDESDGGTGLGQLWLARALLWAFRVPRHATQLRLDHVALVLPPVELQQYDTLVAGAEPMPYFRSLEAYLSASSALSQSLITSAVTTGGAGAANTSTAAISSADASSAYPLSFRSLYLPGIYGTNVSLTFLPGHYQNWSSSMYDQENANVGAPYWVPWRIAVIVLGIIACIAMSLVAAAQLAIQRARRHSAAATAGASAKRGDVEAGAGVRGAARAGEARQVATSSVERPPLFDSFDDPAFELDIVRGAKPSAADVADILLRINAEASEFNMEMTELLGCGSFGVVYGGYWHGLKVAIKTLVFNESQSTLSDGGQRARQQCIRESAFCCTMHHPNVVATHHFYLKSTKRVNMLDLAAMQQNEIKATAADEDCGAQRRDLIRAGSGEGVPSAGLAPAEETEGGRGGRARKTPQSCKPPQSTAVTDWRLFLIQEYCDGGSLRQALDKGELFRFEVSWAEAAEEEGSAARPTLLASDGSEQTPTFEATLGAAKKHRAAGQEDKNNGQRGGGARCGVDGAGGDGSNAVATAALLPAPQPMVRRAGAQACADLGAPSDGASAEAGLIVVQTGQASRDCSGPAKVPGKSGAPDGLSPGPCPSAPALLPSTSDADQRPRALHALALPSSLVTANTGVTSTSFTTTGNTTPQAECAVAAAAAHCLPTGTRPSQLLVTSIRAALGRAAATGAAVAAAPAAAPADALPAELSVIVHTALGIASGVAYLHSRSIIHGDLSANNVLLVRTDQPHAPVEAKISDFGLSMRLPAGQDHLKDVHHGTPYYQSPEVMEQGTCSLSADVYSLGVLLWELYHGAPPWRGRRGKAAKQPKAPPVPPAEQPLAEQPAADGDGSGERPLGLGPDGVWHDPDYRLRACDVLEIAGHCPRRYANLVRRCLAADPRDRPSARSVVKELLRMERGIATALAATAVLTSPFTTAGVSTIADLQELAKPHAGAVLALARDQTRHSTPGGSADDPTVMLEDYDAAAATVAAALDRVTSGPGAEGAPASLRTIAGSTPTDYGSGSRTPRRMQLAPPST